MPRHESRRFWSVVLVLCAIAAAASVRRLVALEHPSASVSNPMVGLDLLFAGKAALTRAHVLAGLALAVALPFQLSSGIRRRAPRAHRWLGRALVLVGVGVGLSGYAMVAVPVGGPLEVSAILVFATAFLAALLMAWRRIRARDVAGHREWMIRAMAVLLGIATTRPVVGMFFATSRLTGLVPAQFFGPAFWIGFSATALAGEWYVRRTRPGSRAVAMESRRSS